MVEAHLDMLKSAKLAGQLQLPRVPRWDTRRAHAPKAALPLERLIVHPAAEAVPATTDVEPVLCSKDVAAKMLACFALNSSYTQK